MLDQVRVTAATILIRPWAERFYGDGPPHWLMGRDNRPAPSSGRALVERRRRRKRLEKLARRDPDRRAELARLAARLDSCRARHRCLSGACPQCQRALQRWVVWTAPVALRHLGHELGAFSIVPDDVLPITDTRNADRLHGMLAELEQNLARAGIRHVVGGVDCSVNEHQEGEFAPHLSPHFWLIGRRDQIRAGRRIMLNHYPASDLVRRPVRVEPCDGKLRAFAYALKPNFSRRVTLPAIVDDDGVAIKPQNTRSRQLRLEQEVALLLLLDEIGLDARLVLRGVALTQNGSGWPVLRPRMRPRMPSMSAGRIDTS